MTPEETLRFIGFDDGELPLTTAERVAELLHAARAAIVPQPHAPEARQEAKQADTLEQIAEDIASIAEALRHDSELSGAAATEALDHLRKRLRALPSA